MGHDPTLGAYLASWREDSLRPPLSEARARARAAMHAALAAPVAGRYRVRALSLPFGIRLQHRRPLLAVAAAALGGAVLVGLIGWNAPAGSPLYGVRAARQGIQLALPGADQAALRLQYAESSLADARNGIDTGASLADARTELQTAYSELPVDHASPLWGRWDTDESKLAADESQQENHPGTPGVLPGSTSPSPHESSNDGGATATAVPSEGAGGTSYPGAHESPSPSSGGGDGGLSQPPSASPSAG
jgi:hypothetical protein